MLVLYSLYSFEEDASNVDHQEDTSDSYMSTRIVTYM